MREQFVTFWKDLQRAARTWTRSPGNFLATAGSMALAIGANTVIFSALDAVLLRSFPGKDPTRLMMLSPQFSFSYQDYQSIRRNAGAFQDVTCSYPVTVSLSSEERAERVTGELVAANYFEVLGIMPQMGRRFMSDEDLPGSPRNVVILSDNLWKRMGRDSNIIGKAISIGGRQFTVVGVAPPLFNGTLQGVSSEIFAPLPTYAAAVPSFAESNLLSDPEQRGFDVFGRLRLDMTRNEADARLVTTLNWVEERKPRAKRRIVSLHSMTEIPGADGRRLVVWTKVLFVAVTLLLILACINTTGTLLARSLKRDREFATRIALGANRAQLLKLMLAEGLTLCVVASGIGLVIALILAPFLSRLSLPVDLPLQTAFHIALRVDQPVFVYTCGVCVSSTLVFALVLALSVPLSDVNVRLRTPLQSVGLGRYVLSRNMLLIAQIAIATSLLIVAGLFVRSLSRAASTDIGFSRDHSLLLRIDPRAAGRDVPATLRLLERTRSDISSIPGVERAAYTTLMPLGGFASASGFAPSDKSSDMSIQADVFATNSDFVQALRIPLLEGKGFDSEANANSEPVIIISQSFAKRLYPGRDPLGMQVIGGYPATLYRIAGVISDIKPERITEPVAPIAIILLQQNPMRAAYAQDFTFIVRTFQPPKFLLETVRQRVQAQDSSVPVFDVETTEMYVLHAAATLRISALVFGCFALLGSIIAAVGVYGMLSFDVVARRKDMAIRVAFGAHPAAVAGSLIHDVMSVSLVGLALGIGLTAICGSYLSALLYGVGPRDVMTFALAAGGVLLIITLAAVGPTMSALSVRPGAVLRHE